MVIVSGCAPYSMGGIFLYLFQSSALKICSIEPELKAKAEKLRFKKDKTNAAIVGRFCLNFRIEFLSILEIFVIISVP